jgi:threonine dehydrogenase-like Zn-dependent dehydrogenase
MQAVTWTGAKSILTTEVPKPTITDPSDVVVRITSSAICGSDLHLYLSSMPGMKSGDIMGHEPMGIVEEVGPNVKKVKVGDRVVCSFCLACGSCYYCQKQLFSGCDRTNPIVAEEKMMGARSSGMFGYSALTGGFAGGQSEYLRVPFADVNCLVVPSQQESNLTDTQLLFLSDILPTAWHGNELAQVSPGDVVAIWGAGPVGILSAHCAFARGARRVILVDRVAYRLDYAKSKIPNLETVDFSKARDSGEAQVAELCKNELAGAPDCCIECVGMHYTNSLMHRVEMAIGLETDSPEALNACLVAVRKGGHVAAIGAYGGFANHFNIGALMEKGLTIGSGQTPVHRYWKDLLQRVINKELDPTIVVTHNMTLPEASKAYQMFNDKKDNVIKVVLHPQPSS